ncbi:MAG: ferredoxin [Patescibacteria group bacterium]
MLKDNIYKTTEGRKIYIEIDPDICIGAASCVGIDPKTFALDKDNKAYILNDNVSDYETILEAAKSCPTSAIILKDEDENQIWP